MKVPIIWRGFTNVWPITRGPYRINHLESWSSCVSYSVFLCVKGVEFHSKANYLKIEAAQNELYIRRWYYKSHSNRRWTHHKIEHPINNIISKILCIINQSYSLAMFSIISSISLGDQFLFELWDITGVWHSFWMGGLTVAWSSTTSNHLQCISRAPPPCNACPGSL